MPIYEMKRVVCIRHCAQLLTVICQGLFTPEEYVARQKQAQEQAAAAAAAKELQMETAKHEQLQELQVAFSRKCEFLRSLCLFRERKSSVKLR
jgi:hypothetical protein